MAFRISVGIPTIGRPAVLRDTLRELARQSRQPDRILVCGTSDNDMSGAAEGGANVTLLQTQAGLPRQRNAIVAALHDDEVIVFFDDDFLPHPAYLQTVERHMRQDSRIVVATGRVLADGIGGPGLTFEQGRAIIDAATQAADTVTPIFSGYGCNMAIRVGAMRDHGIAFDERLPMYGWQEDVDVSCQLAAYGTVVQLQAACGVHLGVKVGRGSGVRLGYSQVANPLYLAGKRAGYPIGRALSHVACNLAMNLARAPLPEPYVDRRGRLKGNLLAIKDLATGAMIPERVLEM
jgi:GT2 family glycosyltransferase